ncbi:MAG: hypothetical protein NT034_04180 [Candidatus Magasanikbacteria bacterium]|nr:hypothetical protein [Candidatus Magasanikbacteria bacterium]
MNDESNKRTGANITYVTVSQEWLLQLIEAGDLMLKGINEDEEDSRSWEIRMKGIEKWNAAMKNNNL